MLIPGNRTLILATYYNFSFILEEGGHFLLPL